MKKIMKLFFVILLVIVLLFASYLFYLYREAEKVVQQTQITLPSSRKESLKEQLKEEQTLSIILVGIDTGEYGQMDQARADTLILALVNPRKERTTLISIPRDTYTPIGKTGEKDKINHAYAFGGLDLTIESVSQLLSVPIDYGVVLNMTGLTQLVDVVGGINVTNSFSFKQDGYTFDEGRLQLDGVSALAYSRMRKEDPQGDYGRQKRQREVVTNITQNLGSSKLFFNYSTILRVVEDNVLMNLTLNDFIKIGANQHYVNAMKQIDEEQLVGEGTMIDGVSYQVVSEEQLSALKQRIQEEVGK